MDKHYKYVCLQEEEPQSGRELSLLLEGDLYIGRYKKAKDKRDSEMWVDALNRYFGWAYFDTIEWLKEVEPLNNWQDILKIMLDTHQEFLPNSPADHEQSELYMYMAKRIARVEPLNEDEWISVKDKMPEDRIGVLAYISDEDFMTHCHYEYKIKEWLVSDTYRKLKRNVVTHWQPLPSPPKIN